MNNPSLLRSGRSAESHLAKVSEKPSIVCGKLSLPQLGMRGTGAAALTEAARLSHATGCHLPASSIPSPCSHPIVWAEDTRARFQFMDFWPRGKKCCLASHSNHQKEIELKKEKKKEETHITFLLTCNLIPHCAAFELSTSVRGNCPISITYSIKTWGSSQGMLYCVHASFLIFMASSV